MKEKIRAILLAVVLITLLQLLREGLEQQGYLFCEPSDFGRKMITMSAMLLLIPLCIGYARLQRMPLSVFPPRFSKWYIIATAVAAVLLISTPSNYTGGYHAILAIFYGSIVTPVFEELVFRGYLWNKLETVFSKKPMVCLLTTLLFTLWHVFYMMPNIASGSWTAVAWKLTAGLGYGAVLDGGEKLADGDCAAAAAVTQACRYQSRGFSEGKDLPQNDLIYTGKEYATQREGALQMQRALLFPAAVQTA